MTIAAVLNSASGENVQQLNTKVWLSVQFRRKRNGSTLASKLHKDNVCHYNNLLLAQTHLGLVTDVAEPVFFFLFFFNPNASFPPMTLGGEGILKLMYEHLMV